MLKNYLIVTFRNLGKTKLFSLINILGLAIGIAASLLILRYVNFERSYDRFHDYTDRIYRIRYERTSEDGSAVRFASCCPPAGKLIRERYPEAEQLARIMRYQAVVLKDNIRFTEQNMYFMEPDFFRIFNFKFVEGNPLQDLSTPDHAFLSQTTARKYFGDKNPLGEIISIDNKTDYKIAGIFEDVPANSHLKFDIVLSFPNVQRIYGDEYLTAWGHTGMYTYVKLKPGTNIAAFKEKLAQLVDTEFGEALKYYNMKMELPLQPLTDIHLTSHFMQEYEVNGNVQTVNYLFIIAIFILIIAWVNYINLSTSRAMIRAREVGLRKVIGATRTQIVFQFLFETVMINIISLITAILIIYITLPLFNQLTNIPLTISFWSASWFWIAIVLLFFTGIIFSGIYPVVLMSSFKPVLILKGMMVSDRRSINMRRILVTGQFILAMVLVTATISVYKQINFLQNQDLGFNIDQIVVIKAPRVKDDSYNEKLVTFKENLLKNSDIANMSVVTEVPGRQILWDNGGIMKAGEDISKSKNYQIVGVDYDFVDVFDVQMIAGRNFSREFTTDEKALMFNETAVQWMGFASPEAAVGQKVDYWGEIYTLIGVIKDYHQQSPKAAFEPHIYRFAPQGRGRFALFAIKINTQNLQTTMKKIESEYSAFFPGNPFDSFFLDEYFNQQYQADILIGNVIGIFSILAVFVTSLGILGLAAISSARRTKEIGIRKVLGAEVKQVLYLLVSDYLRLILISFIIAVPFLYLGIYHWLNSFALKMDVSADLFLWPVGIILLVTLATVGTHVVKTAMANPVKSLRYE